MSAPYATEEERLAARRRSWQRGHLKRRTKARRSFYRQLCVRFGEEPIAANAHWTPHFVRLRRQLKLVVPRENWALWVDASSPLQRFWLERFSLAEIRALAAGLDVLSDGATPARRARAVAG